MTTSVTAVLAAAFDDATDAGVLAARDLVARAGGRLPVRPRHRPHVTLAAVRVHPGQVEAVAALLHDTVAGTSPVRLRLGRVGTFGRAGALWLGPDDATDLCALQRSVFEAVATGPWPVAFGGRTEPATWVPHCSLATRLDPVTLARAAAAVRAGWQPVDALVAGVAVVLVGGAGDVGLVPLADARPSSWPGPRDDRRPAQSK